MYAVPRSFPAVVVLFAATFFGSTAFSQSARFFSVETRGVGLLGPASSSDPCSVNENGSIGARAGDRNASACSHALGKTSAPVSAAPCNRSIPALTPCPASSDAVRDNLHTMGKPGQLILRARDRVLDILETENACTDWYRTRNSDPAAVFRTLAFAVDRKGEAFVRKAPGEGGFEMIHNPYVASVEQDGGPYSTVILNANGAFFFPAAGLVEDRFKSGPLTFHGTRWIQVGPYVGGSFRAQVLVLLHELGHVIDLLPEDREDRDGKSRQNSLDVLRACRAEVESKEPPHTFLATR